MLPRHALWIVALSATIAHGQDPKPEYDPDDRIDDAAGLLDADGHAELEGLAAACEARTGVRVLVRTLAGPQPLPAAELAKRELDGWPHHARTALVLVTREPRQVWIEPTPLMQRLLSPSTCASIASRAARDLGLRSAIDEIARPFQGIGPPPALVRDTVGLLTSDGIADVTSRSQALAARHGVRFLTAFVWHGEPDPDWDFVTWLFAWWELGESDVLVAHVYHATHSAGGDGRASDVIRGKAAVARLGHHWRALFEGISSTLGNRRRSEFDAGLAEALRVSLLRTMDRLEAPLSLPPPPPSVPPPPPAPAAGPSLSLVEWIRLIAGPSPLEDLVSLFVGCGWLVGFVGTPICALYLIRSRPCASCQTSYRHTHMQGSLLCKACGANVQWILARAPRWHRLVIPVSYASWLVLAAVVSGLAGSADPVPLAIAGIACLIASVAVLTTWRVETSLCKGCGRLLPEPQRVVSREQVGQEEGECKLVTTCPCGQREVVACIIEGPPKKSP